MSAVRRNLKEAAVSRTADGLTNISAMGEVFCLAEMDLIGAVVERENMTTAYKRVVGNKGSAGVDKMTVDDLLPHLHAHWQTIKAEIL